MIHPTPFLAAAVLTVGAHALAGGGALFTLVDAPVPQAVVTASGVASPSSADLGSCVGYALDVSGTQDGIAIEPITATLTGPYPDGPAIGNVADGASAGGFAATWTGDEWSYSGDCVTPDAAGDYAWTLENPNDPNGLDLIIDTQDVVSISEPTVVDPEPGPGEDGDGDATVEDHATVADGSTSIDLAASSTSKTSRHSKQLAVTGFDETLTLSALLAGSVAIAAGAVLAQRARRKRVAAADTNEVRA